MEFLFQCWKSANEWNIVSTREEKFLIKIISFKSQMVGPLDFWKEAGNFYYEWLYFCWRQEHLLRGLKYRSHSTSQNYNSLFHRQINKPHRSPSMKTVTCILSCGKGTRILDLYWLLLRWPLPFQIFPLTLQSFWFWDEIDYEEEMFSASTSRASLVWTRHFGGKRDNRPFKHCTHYLSQHWLRAYS